MIRKMTVALVEKGKVDTREITVEEVVIAGWTGRDKVAVEKHIVELEALGVKRPASTPVYYRVSNSRLTTATRIQVSGGASSGEAEFVLLMLDGRLWIGVGSDHTDREVEVVGVAISKQLCDKPIGKVFWPYDEVADHWDSLILRSYVTENNEVSLYQEGSVATMLAPLELIEGYTNGKPNLPGNSVMFCGTLAAKGGIRPAQKFHFEIDDPVLGRKINHEYAIECLPIAG
ncbi:DUF2848 domain-containing protein [Noviherbaspirillum sp.]|uniref:DUF2848 domain-containing protein n=1 Tax=Noviherbaspirillum sp. TaxID=1926288 RepID=UPI002B481FB5|nr:DUF2848 domain-containing protein [Noviherbaspirillum sp.]HJV80957.1 DUF2848 domain-containing protein [Noviherbaspirillum sp.]